MVSSLGYMVHDFESTGYMDDGFKIWDTSLHGFGGIGVQGTMNIVSY